MRRQPNHEEELSFRFLGCPWAFTSSAESHKSHTVFGSKHLLIAFINGIAGLGLVFIGVSEVENLKFWQFFVGVVLIWGSSLFGSFIAGCEVAKKSSDKDKSP